MSDKYEYRIYGKPMVYDSDGKWKTANPVMGQSCDKAALLQLGEDGMPLSDDVFDNMPEQLPKRK